MASDVQADLDNTSKGPLTPSELTPPRPLLSPAHSTQHGSAVVDQAADEEWVLSKAATRRARQARRDLPNKAVNKGSSVLHKTEHKHHQGPEHIDKKAPTKTMRPAVKGSTALPHTAVPDMLTTHSQPKHMNYTETYSSAVGQNQRITDVVVPLIGGTKAPLNHLLKPFCSQDHKRKQLDKLQCGASPFATYRSVRGMPSLLPCCLSRL